MANSKSKKKNTRQSTKANSQSQAQAADLADVVEGAVSTKRTRLLGPPSEEPHDGTAQTVGRANTRGQGKDKRGHGGKAAGAGRGSSVLAGPEDGDENVPPSSAPSKKSKVTLRVNPPKSTDQQSGTLSETGGPQQLAVVSHRTPLGASNTQPQSNLSHPAHPSTPSSAIPSIHPPRLASPQINRPDNPPSTAQRLPSNRLASAIAARTPTRDLQVPPRSQASPAPRAIGTNGVANGMSSAGLSQVTLQLQNRITSLERLLRAAENARPGAAPKAAAASDKGPTRTHVVLDSEDEIMDDPEADQVEQNSSGSMQEDAEDPEPATKRLRRFSDTELKRIRVYAKKFTVMGMIWLRDPADTFALGSDSDYDPVHRFDSEETALQGQYQDLAELVSKNFHDFFDEYQFQKVFNKAMQNHRSHLANMLRRKSGSAIFLVRQQELRCSTSREQFKRLVGWDKKARTKGNKKVAGYHTWAPILYLNENPAEGPYAVFRHPTLIAIAQAMLWGPAAIYVDLKDVVFYGTVSGRQWGVRRTTPGLIAGAAIWARWIISVDPTFNPVGPISNIPYQEDFDCYLKYLLKGLAENKNAVINLFKTWDKEVFDAKGLQEDPSRGIDSYEQQLYEQLENDGEPIEIDGEEDETEEEEEEEEEENEAEGGQEDRQGVEHDEEAAEGAVDADLNFNGSGYEGPGYDDNGEIQEADPTHQVEE